jgi:membrane-bound lytic murein transglycosylase B
MLVRILVIIATLISPIAARGEHSISIAAVGDINMGTSFPSEDYLPKDGGNSLFASVRDYFRGDIIFGNLEGPLLDEGQTKKCKSSGGCYAFKTPTAYIKHLMEVGFNVMSIANNHAMDFGPDGVKSTIKTLDLAGIAHSGPIGDIASMNIKGKKVALVAYTTADHSHYLLDIPAAITLITKLDKTHDLIIVSFHGGTEGSKATRVKDEMEYLGKEPRGHLIQFTHAVIDAGADLVLGHGPHVLRGLEVYKRRLIVYSMGNFCTYGRFSLSGPLGIGAVFNIKIDADSGEFLTAKVHSTIQNKPGGALPDSSNQAFEMLAKLSQLDFPFSAPDFKDNNQFVAPQGDGAGFFTLNFAEDRIKLRQILDSFKAAKIDPQKLRIWFGDLRAKLNPKVLERFAKPAEKLPYSEYRKIFWKPEILAGGKKFIQEKQDLLLAVEKKFGVDHQVLTGLVATETRFGQHRGDYLTFNALTTLALKYTRRSSWAQKELQALLEVFSQDPLEVKGSYAGAVGLVQFMPTSIQHYGVDYDNDGKIDLAGWADALGSAANYLKKHGYKKGQPIKKGTKAYQAIYRYNPAHHYVRIIGEFADAFGYLKEERANAKHLVD